MNILTTISLVQTNDEDRSKTNGVYFWQTL